MRLCSPPEDGRSDSRARVHRATAPAAFADPPKQNCDWGNSNNSEDTPGPTTIRATRAATTTAATEPRRASHGRIEGPLCGPSGSAPRPLRGSTTRRTGRRRVTRGKRSRAPAGKSTRSRRAQMHGYQQTERHCCFSKKKKKTEAGAARPPVGTAGRLLVVQGGASRGLGTRRSQTPQKEHSATCDAALASWEEDWLAQVAGRSCSGVRCLGVRFSLTRGGAARCGCCGPDRSQGRAGAA